MISVLIVGAGAIGIIYGNYLKKGLGDEVRVGLVARSNYQALKDYGGGTIVRGLGDGRTVEKFVPDELLSAAEESYEGEKYDYLFLTNKITGDQVVKGLSKYAHKDSLMVLTQNGVDIEEPYKEAYPGVALASAVAYIATSLTAPTEATHFSPFFKFNAGIVFMDSSTDRYKQAYQRLELLAKKSVESGLTSFELSTNIIQDRWRKMLWNGTMNTLAAITDLTLPELMDDLGYEEIMREVCMEIWRVGLAAVGEDSWLAEDVVDEIITFTKQAQFEGFVPSTLQDVRKGKPIEYEAICGNVVKAAKKRNVAVPQLRLLYKLLQAVNYKIEKKL
jgi:2-dehydropantoate 2-reductase